MENDSTAKDLGVSSDLVQLLMEVGYVATGRGLQSRAKAIFNGLIAARPNNELPLIGLAVNELNFGNVGEAAKILVERALVVNPNSEMAKCFLAIAVKALGHEQESKELLQQVLDNCSDPAAKRLAESLLSGKDIPG
jgi:predicted Zn-dependent protease